MLIRQILIASPLQIKYKWTALKISFFSRGCASFFTNTKGPGGSL